MSVDISQTICEAIDLIINKRLSTAPFNKTIEGKINSVVNVNQRKYKVTYTGGPGTIVAYGLQGSSYKKNDMVFILMPSNGDCIILGKRETLQQANVSNRNSYTKIGETIVYRDSNTAVTASFGNLCSYGNNNLSEPHNRDQVVFVSSKTEANSSDEALKNYIKSSPNGVVLSAIVSTRLAATQIGGNYGVKFKIVFHRKTDYTKFRQQEYVLDVRDIVGVNPYLVQEAMYVEHIIPASQFDFENFAYVKQVKAFCDGFPYDSNIAGITAGNNNKSPYYDITVVNPSICTAFVISPEESKDYHLFLEAEKGNFLGITDSAGHTVNSLPVKAVLKHNGEQSVTDVIYRWFVKDQSIGVGNDNYHEYAGPGWCYINKKKSNGRNRYSVRTFNFTTEVPNPLTQDWDKNNYLIRNNLTTVKCIAELGGDRWENETQIHFDNGIKIWITNNVVSNLENNNYIFNNKARFAFKCNYQDDQQVTNDNPQKGFDTDRYNYKLSWKLIANQRDQRTIIKTNNNEYFYLGDQYNNTGSGNERLFIEDIAHGILSCSIERQLKEPTGSPYIFLGSTKIDFYYKPGTGNYYLDIQNGNRLMQFDQTGKFLAPDSGLVIEPLIFSLIDPNGNEVKKISTEEEPSRIIAWLWEVPKTKTLIKVEGTAQTNSGEINIPEDIFANHNYYKGTVQAEGVEENSIGSLAWIPNTYNAKAVNNTIKLYVLFKKKLTDKVPTQIQATTVFTPIKMGDPGTNGTNTFMDISPYNGDNIINTTRIYAYHYGTGNSNKVLRGFYSDSNFNLINKNFHLKSRIFHDNVNVTGTLTTVWELPVDKKYNATTPFSSFLGIITAQQSQTNVDLGTGNNDPTTIKTIEATDVYIGHDHTQTLPTAIYPKDTDLARTAHASFSQNGADDFSAANIVKATITNSSGLKYYNQYPICYVHTTNSSYKIRIKQGTGYTYVVYDEAGRNPRYNGPNTFTIQVFKEVNGTLQTVTDGLQYEWYRFTKPAAGSSIINFQTLVNYTTDTVTCYPSITSTGSDFTRALLCQVKDSNDSVIGIIHIPIIFYLNRFNHRYLNEWDGHSIQLDANNNGTILAPEVGAGKKEDDNSFTGVLMGRVTTNNNNTVKEETGLFGYDKGQRSFFLDATNGMATFGKVSNGQGGQIIINPQYKIRQAANNNNGNDSTARPAALLYSNNYTLPTAQTVSGQKVITLDVSQHSTNGMIIDLSTPQIGFGNKKFYVTKDGLLHATGATISGNVTIDTNSAGYNTLKNNLNQDLDIPDVQGLAVKTFNYSTSGENEDNQIIRGYAGIGSKKMPNCDINYDFGSSYTSVVTPGTNPSTNDRTADKDAGNVRYFRLWAGTGTGTAQQSFGVDHQGILYAKGAYIQGNIQANSKIGNNNTVSSSGNISATRVGMGRTQNPIDVTNFPGMTGTKYLNLWGKSNSSELGKSNLVFGITENGDVLARSAHITGTINATQGNIGGWQLVSSSNRLTYLNHSTDTRRIYLSPDENASRSIAVGTRADSTKDWSYPFYVEPNGILHATGAEIKDGNITLSSTSQTALINNIKGTIIQGLAVQVEDEGSVTSGANIKRGYAGLGSLKTKGSDIKTQFGGTKPSSDGDYYLRFWSGSGGTTISKLNFAVGADGYLYAKNATISGHITATSGSFTGTVTASSGKIGKWEIDANKLSLGTVGMGQNVITPSQFNDSFGYTPGNNVTGRLWAGSTANDNSKLKFLVTSSGTLWCYDARIRNASIDLASIPTITTEKIQAGAITANKIATNAITSDKIQADAITSNKIQAGAITSDKIQAGAITTGKLTITQDSGTNISDQKWRNISYVTTISASTSSNTVRTRVTLTYTRAYITVFSGSSAQGAESGSTYFDINK